MEQLLDILSNPEVLAAVRALLLVIIGGVTLVAGALLRRWARLLGAQADGYERANLAAAVLTEVKAAEQRGASQHGPDGGSRKYNAVVTALMRRGLDGLVNANDIEAAVLDVNKEYGMLRTDVQDAPADMRDDG